jgi:hypothetical protein
MEELYSSHGVAGADRHDLGEYASMAAGDVIKQKLQAMDETALVQSLAADAEVRSALDQLCQTAWTAACDKWIESVLTQPWNPRRALIGWAKMAVYPKHLKGKSEADAQAKSNGGDAQYWPLDGYEDLVRDTLLNGQWGREGTTVHAYSDYGARIIGFDGGKPTGRHRAEITQGSPPEMHGHPRISW